MEVIFSVPGKPKGKGRPRFAGRGKVYTPESTKRYENLIALTYKSKIGEMFYGPLSVSIDCYFAIPKGTAKNKIADMINGKIMPEVTPDADNISKAVLDALNGIAYKDDKQVAKLYVAKYYTKFEPETVVQIKNLK